MTTAHPLALNLDPATHAALQALSGNDGQSLQATATRLLQDALRTRQIGARPAFFSGLDTAPVETRRATIARQAQALAAKFNQNRTA